VNHGVASAFQVIEVRGGIGVVFLMVKFAGGNAVDLSGYADWKLVASLSANGEAVCMNGNELQLPAYGVAVLLPN